MAGEVQDVLLSIPRIYTTIAQFFTIFLYLMYSPKKHTKNKRILMHSFFFIAFISFQYCVSTLNLNLWIFGIILSVALMFIYIYVVSDNNVFTSAYITILAFIVSELVASLAWQLEYFLIVNNNIKFFDFLIYSSTR